MPSVARNFLLASLATVIGIVAVVAVLEIVFRVLPTSGSLQAQAVNRENPVMRFAPNRDLWISRGPAFRPRARKHVNNLGFVNDHDYERDPSRPLIAVIGDSYVEATQVTNSESLNGQLAKLLGPSVRVYSFGASGAALPSYLAYARYASSEFRLSALVIVIVGNDFDESWLEVKNAPGFHYWRRTGAGIESLLVDYQPSSWKRLARKSALARYLFLNLKVDPSRLLGYFLSPAGAEVQEFAGNTAVAADAGRLELGRTAVDYFLARLPHDAALEPGRIVLVVDGIRPQVYGDEPLAGADSYFGLMRRYVLQTAPTQGYEVIDLHNVFRAAHERMRQRFEFADDAHWNAAGHQVVAEAIKAVRPIQEQIPTRTQ